MIKSSSCPGVLLENGHGMTMNLDFHGLLYDQDILSGHLVLFLHREV